MAVARRRPGSAGNPVRRGRKPLRRLRALPRRPRRPAVAVARSGADLLSHRAGRVAGRTRPAARRPGPQFRVRNGGQPREPARRNDVAGLESAYRPAATGGGPHPPARPGRTCRDVGRGARRPVRAGCRRRRRAVLAGQRTPRPRAGPADVPHRPRPGHQRRMAAVRRRRRLPAAPVVVSARLEASPDRRPDRAAVLGQPTGRPAPGSAMSRTSPPTNRSSTSAISRPRPTRHGPAPGCPPNANGRRRARGTRSGARADAIPGAPRNRRRPTPTSAATRCGRHPSAPIPTAHRPTVSSRCSATYGSGPARSWSRGRDSPR